MLKNTDISTIAADHSKEQAARLAALVEALDVVPGAVQAIKDSVHYNLFTVVVGGEKSGYMVLTETEAKDHFHNNFHRIPAADFIAACDLKADNYCAAQELENSLISLRYHAGVAPGPFMRAVAEKCGAMEKLWNDPEVRAAVIATGYDEKEYTANGFYIYSW